MFPCMFPPFPLTCSPLFLTVLGMAEQLPTPETIRVGSTIREFREMRGLKADELANKILISRSYLANIEAGRKRLQPELAAKIAHHLAVRQISILRPDEWPADLQEAV